jgi:hypothetical protein
MGCTQLARVSSNKHIKGGQFAPSALQSNTVEFNAAHPTSIKPSLPAVSYKDVLSFDLLRCFHCTCRGGFRRRQPVQHRCRAVLQPSPGGAPLTLLWRWSEADCFPIHRLATLLSLSFSRSSVLTSVRSLALLVLTAAQSPSSVLAATSASRPPYAAKITTSYVF